MFSLPKRLLKEAQGRYDHRLSSVEETGVNSARDAFEIWDSHFGEITPPKKGKDDFLLCSRKVIWITPGTENSRHVTIPGLRQHHGMRFIFDDSNKLIENFIELKKLSCVCAGCKDGTECGIDNDWKQHKLVLKEGFEESDDDIDDSEYVDL